MNIKAIIFDFGQVLNAPIDVERDRLRRKQLADQLNLSEDELWSYLFESDASVLWMTGRLDWDGFWMAVLEPRGIKDPQTIRDFADLIFEDDHIPHPEMIDLIQRLRGLYKLAVLSNSSRSEEELAVLIQRDCKLPADYFDAIVTSTSFGAVKPDPAIYAEVLRRLDVTGNEAVFTDDMPSFTRVAADLGMVTHTFTTPANFINFLGKIGVLPLSDSID